ncbi:hypothetical protein SULI_13385 [Saccharolobus solfataricus]|nr:hypothetical protein [Saccharolobus solfataricus]AKA74725.1 hypothetical protein SULB_2630 [Saccharolobus solfataricus]AKA77420.1 hypothetical protein SULC_2626 [Saccharolobus solfataricus]AKA80111.1 hypothetical protein SULA_2629 [Saccharolobus solfataricus]AZF69191.1 hypothetical protein SULG_13385 [Saccharolobus solfataricus]AZF71811.1 hypothetical protein SULH_13385 [Saccharolobus solfataricus]
MIRYIIDTRVLELPHYEIIERKIDEIRESEGIVIISEVDPIRVLARLKIQKKVDIIVRLIHKNNQEEKKWIIYLIKSSYR